MELSHRPSKEITSRFEHVKYDGPSQISDDVVLPILLSIVLFVAVNKNKKLRPDGHTFLIKCLYMYVGIQIISSGGSRSTVCTRYVFLNFSNSTYFLERRGGLVPV